jgi:hypothetical protein
MSGRIDEMENCGTELMADICHTDDAQDLAWQIVCEEPNGSDAMVHLSRDDQVMFWQAITEVVVVSWPIVQGIEWLDYDTKVIRQRFFAEVRRTYY